MSRVLVYYHYVGDASYCFDVGAKSNLYALLSGAAGTMQNADELTDRQEKAHAYCHLRCGKPAGASFDNTYYETLDQHFGSKEKAKAIYDLGAEKVEGRQDVTDLQVTEILHIHFAV